MGGQHPQAWAGRGRSSCSATALWSLPGSLTMTLSASSMWGERGNAGVRWTGARGPLARIAVFGTFRQLRSCGTRRPPPMSVRGLSGVGLTSAPHRTFADPAPPPPDSVGDRHHGLVNQPIQCGGNRGVCWTDAQAPCQDRREAAELWNPVAAHLLCLGAVCAVCAPRLHFCTSAFHLLCPSSPSGSYHPRCHLRRYHGESLSKKGTYLMK